MALTPVPNLATIVGTLSAMKVDVFAARDVYASSLAAIPDCNPKTGGKVNPATNAPVTGTPTDSEPILNAFLAHPTGRLVIDGGYAIGKALVVHPGNAIVQLDDRCGIFVLSGANSNAIQNFPHGDLNTYTAWGPAGSQAGLGGAGYWIENLYINGNRGTFPNGNSNGTRDGTMNSGNAPNADFTTPGDARGPFVAGYWLSGIILVGASEVHINRVKLFDIPTYGINLYHCVNVELNNNRCDAGDPTFSGNTDFIHLNGGCAKVNGTGTVASVGDDVFGINADEGDGQPISDVCFSNTTVTNCQSVVRVYGRNVRVNRVQVHHLKGSGIRYWVSQIGLGPGQPSLIPECSGSVEFSDWDVQSIGPGAGYGHSTVYITGGAGVVELNRIKHHESSQPMPMVMMDTASVVGSLRMNDCSIHRNTYNNAPTFAVYGSAGTIGDLWINGFRVTQQVGQTYADIPILVDLVGTAVGHVTIGGRFEGVGNILNISTASVVGGISINDLDHVSHAGSPASYSVVAATAGHSTKIPVSVGRYSPGNLLGLVDPASDVALTGPGLVSSGFAFADAMIADNSIYKSSDQGTLCWKSAGVAIPLGTVPAATSYTIAGPASGRTGSASGAFSVQPNGTYTGTITITPSGGGLSTPIVKTFSGSSAPQTFTITPTADGTVTLTGTNGGGLTNPTSPTSYAASTPVTTLFSDAFAITGGRTVGSSVTGTAPDATQFGSVVYGDFTPGLPNLVMATGGGITSASGSAGSGYGGYDMTGATAAGGEKYTFDFVGDAASVFIFQVRRHDPGTGLCYIDTGWNYSTGGFTMSRHTDGGGAVGTVTQAFSFVPGTRYTAVISLATSGGATTATVTVVPSSGGSPTTLASGYSIPDASLQSPSLLVFGTTSGAVGAAVVKSAKYDSL